MSLKRRFFQYVIPSILAMLVFNLYTMVDGIFVAKYVGETALAAVNLAMPYINFIFAFSLLFSMGASTLISIYRGQKNKEKANTTFTQNIVVVSILAILMTLFCHFFLEEIALFLGAEADTLEYVKQYLGIISAFSFFFIVSYSMEVLIKADGFPKKAMLGVSLGAITNIILDAIFLHFFNGGIQGAAIATGIAQMLTFGVFAWHFISGKSALRLTKFKFDLSIYKQIIPIGFADCITELSAGVIVFSFNHVILSIIGTSGVISYTVITYVYNLVLMVMVGISQGMQPQVSYYVGKKERSTVLILFRYALWTVAGFSVLITVVCLVFAPAISSVFIHPSETALSAQTIQAFRIYALSYLILGFNVVTSGFCAATLKPKLALTLSIARGLVVILIVLFSLSALFQEIGIWISPLVSEALCLIFTLSLIFKEFAKKTDIL